MTQILLDTHGFLFNNDQTDLSPWFQPWVDENTELMNKFQRGLFLQPMVETMG